MLQAPLVFDDFRLEPDEARLWHGDAVVPLPPKLCSLLEVFATHPHRLLTKNELLDRVWPGLHVTEGVLKTAVQQLREVLGDDARAPRWIATIPRRGYRFLAAVRRDTLPTYLSRFIGREPQVEELIQRLGEGGLTTLVGAGGAGKTRLAVEAARGLHGRFPRVVWIDLAGTREEEMVPHLLAAELGVREHAGSDLLTVLASLTRSRELLLILDNCEHLTRSVAELARQLLHRDGAAILATSREPLALHGEKVYPLPPLALPPADAAPERLAANEAVRLFQDRADLHGTGLATGTPDALALVAAICRRLDGIPLAIELAAARLRVLSLPQLLERLDSALDLLNAPDPGTPPRHHTLRATVEWSLRLLSPPESALLRQLAVFAGGFTLEAAEAVAAAAAPASPAVLPVLERLVAKSVVEIRRDRGGATRFHLLEAIRQAMAEEEAPPQLRDAHCGFFTALAEEAAPHLTAGGRAPWLDRLALESDNLRLALAWTRRRPAQRETGLRLAAALIWYWYFRGAWGEGRRQLRRTLESSGASAVALAVPVHFGLGFLAFGAGDYPEARRHLEACLGAKSTAAAPYQGMARTFLSQLELGDGGDLERALVLAEEGIRILRQGSPSWYLAITLNNLGNVHRARGALEAARRVYTTSLDLLAEVGDDGWARAMALRNLGTLEANEGRDEAAAQLFRRSLSALRAEPEPWFLSRGLEELAGIEARRGRPETAARLLGAAEALRETIGAPIVAYYQQGYQAAVATTRGALGEDQCAALWAAGRRLSLEAVLEAVSEEGPP